MSLRTPQLKKLHTRSVICEGYIDPHTELFTIIGHLQDIKTFDLPNIDRGGIIPTGEPLHDLELQLIVSKNLEIMEAQAFLFKTPYQMCPDIAPAFSALKGLQLQSGFRKSVMEILGGIKGCTHLVEMLSIIATTAIQTIMTESLAPKNSDNAEKKKNRHNPFLNTCHSLCASSEVVKRDFPDYYSPPKN